MNHYLENLCEQIDAAVFSGDTLENSRTLDGFKNYLDRWGRDMAVRLAERAGYIDGRERRECAPGDLAPYLHDTYRRAHAEGLAVPTLLDANGNRSIFDDVDV